MRRLRVTDGTPSHRRAGRYHMAKCRGAGPLQEQLRSEMADVDTTEVAMENAIRDIDAEAAKVDRADASRNAQRSIFPNGYGEMIDPEGEVQLTVMPKLRVRMAPFAALPGMPEAIGRLDQAEAAFRAALTAEKTATESVDSLFAEEHAARRAIREQIESAYGRLRDLYKSRPALAERFFLNEGWQRKSKKETPSPAPAPGAPAPGAPAPGAPAPGAPAPAK